MRYEITAPDGTRWEVSAPEGASEAEVMAYAQKQWAAKRPATGYTRQSLRDFALSSPIGAVARGIKDVIDTGALGLATLADKVTGGSEAQRVRAMNEAGKAEFKAATQAPGAPPSLLPAVARIGGNVAATLPAVSALGGAVAPVLPRLGAAIRSGGMATGGAPVGAVARAGDMGIRVAGGAIGGGVAAGMVNPEDAALGAGIGAVLPPALAATGVGGNALGQIFRSREAKAGAALAQALDADDVNALAALLREAPELVPGSRPTVAQALQTPQAGILERVVSDSPGGIRLKEALQEQGVARLAALESVAPVSPTGFAAARADVGTAVQRGAQAERKQAADAVDAMYRAVDPALETRIVLPADKMAAAAEKFLGSGAVGENVAPRSFAAEARRLSSPVQQPIDPVMIGSTGQQMRPRGSSWDEVLRMRSSLNEEWLKAKNAGDRQAAAALDAQKRILDEAIEEQLPPSVFNQWREANASRAAMGQRFDTGPGAAIFQTRDGVPVVQGGEVASMFWGNRPGLAEDVDAFRKLIADNPRLLGQFRSMVTTEGAETAGASGNLATKFVRWFENRRPGLERAFDKSGFEVLERLAKDVKRAEFAAAAGSARGSNTYQNAANALSLGLLDSPFAQAAANRLPYIGGGMEWLRDTARTGRARQLAEVLADANAAADALVLGQPTRLMVNGQPVAPALEALLSRSVPVASADR